MYILSNTLEPVKDTVFVKFGCNGYNANLSPFLKDKPPRSNSANTCGFNGGKYAISSGKIASPLDNF